MTAAAGVFLNWGSARSCKGHHHWGKTAACRTCGGPTPLRDCDGRPCHKVCAEAEATAAADRVIRAATRQTTEHQEAMG